MDSFTIGYFQTQFIDKKCTASKTSLLCTIMIADMFLKNTFYIYKIYCWRTNPAYFTWQTQNAHIEHSHENISIRLPQQQKFLINFHLHGMDLPYNSTSASDQTRIS